MAKLYYTKNIKELIDKKIADDGAVIINSKDITDEQVIRFVNELRVFKKYAYEMIEEMEEADRLDDEEMEAWRTKKAAEAENHDK